jgi:hypothetical protein
MNLMINESRERRRNEVEAEHMNERSAGERCDAQRRVNSAGTVLADMRKQARRLEERDSSRRRNDEGGRRGGNRAVEEHESVRSM